MLTWIEAFAFTQLVEIPIYLLAQRSRAPRWWTALLVAFAASLWTHPFVWYAFPLLPRAWGCTGSIRCWQQQLVLAEAFAVLVEAAWLWHRGVPRPLMWSLLANGASLGLGAWLFW